MKTTYWVAGSLGSLALAVLMASRGRVGGGFGGGAVCWAILTRMGDRDQLPAREVGWPEGWQSWGELPAREVDSVQVEAPVATPVEAPITPETSAEPHPETAK